MMLTIILNFISQRKGHVIMDVCESDGSLQVPLLPHFFCVFLNTSLLVFVT